MSWGFAAFAIAALISFAEVFPRFPDYPFLHLIRDRYVQIQVGLDGMVALLVYLVLPSVTDLIGLSWHSRLEDTPALTGLIAGFGSSALLRIHIPYRIADTQIQIGFYPYYRRYTEYFKRRSVSSVTESTRQMFREIYKSGDTVAIWAAAAQSVVGNLSDTVLHGGLSDRLADVDHDIQGRDAGGNSYPELDACQLYFRLMYKALNGSRKNIERYVIESRDQKSSPYQGVDQERLWP